ncbi:monooxygenase family protein [Nesterenkonia aurantiaca]
MIQYWSSIEALYRHAADPESSHRPARAASNRRAQQSPGAAGIWHEI